MGLHKLPTSFPSAPCVAPQMPRLLLVSPSMLFHNSPLLPRATIPQAATTTTTTTTAATTTMLSNRNSQSERGLQGSEVRRITTEEGRKEMHTGGGEAGREPGRSLVIETGERTTVPEDREIERRRREEEEDEEEEERTIILEDGEIKRRRREGEEDEEEVEEEERTIILEDGEMEQRRGEGVEEVLEEEDRQEEQVEEEEEEEGFGGCEGGDGGPFLLLSESSGSPAPSLSSCTDTMATEIDREDGQSLATDEETGSRGRNQEECDHNNEDSETERDDEETIERLSWLAWKGRCDAEKTSGEEKSLKKSSVTPDVDRAPSPGEEWNAEHEVRIEETPVCVSEDAGLDDDPRKETKDVAFAQAYLDKVCEALRVFPGKVEEFLGVLNAFERDPEGRSAVELYQRLQPMLQHWPELLQDFAAFLQPEQAHQCGLLAEQQAFERSQRFLRKLELRFGESSILYRKVVKILRGGTRHADLAEIKSQISTLLGCHAQLLEEFWEFFHQLHPLAAEPCQSEGKLHPLAAEPCQSEGKVCTVNETEHSDSQPIRFHMNGQGEEEPLISLGRGKQLPGVSGTLTPVSPREKSLPTPQGITATPTPEPVCAKNISLMPTGEKVVLWTREADRTILTACQQKGANQRTFTAVSAQLGNKTANEVRTRFHDLMRLFHTASRQRRSSEDHSDSDSSSSSKDEPD